MNTQERREKLKVALEPTFPSIVRVVELSDETSKRMKEENRRKREEALRKRALKRAKR